MLNYFRPSRIIKVLLLCSTSSFLIIGYNYIFKNVPVPILVWWTPFNTEPVRVIHCGNHYSCALTNDREHPGLVDAYLFYGSQLELHDVPLPKTKTWAIFHEESPKNLAAFLHKDAQDVFDLTSTFDRNSDFPVTLQYLQSLDNLTGTKYFVSVEKKNNLLNTLAPLLYIQSGCDNPIQRDIYVQELMKHIKVDSYGLCLNNKKLPEGISEIDPLDYNNERFLHFIAQYKFIVAIENSVCHDYITEKLWRALIVGSVPIYLGSPTVEDWLPNKNSAILVKNYGTIKELAEFIELINKNDSLYGSYLTHKTQSEINNNLLKKTMREKLHLGTSEDPIPAFECFVCRAVHEKREASERRFRLIYNCPEPVEALKQENSWKSHWRFGKCQSKAFEKMVKTGIKYSKNGFENLWWDIYHNKRC